MLTQRAPAGLVARAVRLLDVAAAPHGFDRYAEQLVPTWSSTEVRGRVVSVRRQTRSTVTLAVRPNWLWRGFRAGQYTQLSVEIDGVRHTRCYSMANSDRARDLELTVKAHPGGKVSNYLVSQARPGLLVGLTQAQGDFTLPATVVRRLLLVSGGSGITPVMSMLRTLCDAGHEGPVTFVHYCLTPEDLAYGEEVDALASVNTNLRVVRIFTDAPGAGDLDGFVDAAQLDAIDPAWRECDTYACGPAPLMESLGTIFADAKIGARLHTEAFTIAHWVAEAGSAGGSLRFSTSGRTVESDGRPILLQAEAAGLRPASGCRMGICHTCVRPLKSGQVRDVMSGAMTGEPGTSVRICVSAPVGDVEVEL